MSWCRPFRIPMPRRVQCSPQGRQWLVYNPLEPRPRHLDTVSPLPSPVYSPNQYNLQPPLEGSRSAWLDLIPRMELRLVTWLKLWTVHRYVHRMFDFYFIVFFKPTGTNGLLSIWMPVCVWLDQTSDINSNFKEHSKDCFTQWHFGLLGCKTLKSMVCLSMIFDPY